MLQLLWGSASPTTRGPQPRFTVREVTAAACELADADGLSSVSLAKVAARLDLTTSALYRYVESKDALVELMTDFAIGSPPKLEHQEWEEDAHVWVEQLWKKYTEHPWLTEVRVAGMPRHPNRLQWLNALLLVLDRGAVADPIHVALLLDSLARAFAALDTSQDPEGSPPPGWLIAAIQERFPRLAREVGREWTDIDVELSRAVDTVLRGAR